MEKITVEGLDIGKIHIDPKNEILVITAPNNTAPVLMMEALFDMVSKCLKVNNEGMVPRVLVVPYESVLTKLILTANGEFTEMEGE